MATKQLSLNIGDRVRSITEFMYGYDQLMILDFGEDTAFGELDCDYLVLDTLNNIAYDFREGELERVETQS